MEMDSDRECTGRSIKRFECAIAVECPLLAYCAEKLTCCEIAFSWFTFQASVAAHEFFNTIGRQQTIKLMCNQDNSVMTRAGHHTVGLD